MRLKGGMIVKKKFIINTLLVSFMCLFFLGASIANADEIKIQAVNELLSSRFPIERYRVFTSSNKGFFALFTSDMFVNALNGFSELLFEATKFLWQLFDYTVKELYTMNILDRLNTIISSLTGNMWDSFKANYVGIILTFSILYIAKTFFIEGAKTAFIQFGKIFIVLLISGIWFPRSSEYLSTMNDYSFALQAEVISIAGQTDATSSLGANKGNDGSLDTASSNEQATNIIRNELFKQVVYQPFLLLNYGTVDKNKINDYYKDIKNKDIPKGNDGEYLLSKEFNALEDKEKMSVLDELADKNHYLTGDAAAYKVIISIISLVGVFLYGLPITAIAGLNMILQLMAIVYSYILPIVALISLFPKYSNGLVNSILNIAKIFLGKGFLGLLVLIFSLVNLTIDLLIPPSSSVTAIVNTLVKGAIYYLSWKYRDKIIETVVNSITQHKATNNMNFDMKQFNQSMDEFATGELTPNLDIADKLEDIGLDVALNVATEGMYGVASEAGAISNQEQEREQENDDVMDVNVVSSDLETEGEQELEGEFTEINSDEIETLPETEDSFNETEDPVVIDIDDAEINVDETGSETGSETTENVDIPDVGVNADIDGEAGGTASETSHETAGQMAAYVPGQANDSKAVAQLIDQRIQVLQNAPTTNTYNHQENKQEATIYNNSTQTKHETNDYSKEFHQKLRVLRSA